MFGAELTGCQCSDDLSLWTLFRLHINSGVESVREKVKAVLEEVRPFLQRDGGDVDFVDITPENVVQVRLRGACGSCPGATYTLKMGIERALKDKIPEVAAVESVA